MKKYIQIIAVLAIFGALVWWRQSKASDEQPAIVAPSTQNTSAGSTSHSLQATPTTGSSAALYKDGTYTGSVADAFYGNLQVQAVISNGRLTDVIFLQYPNDNRTSQSINEQASVYLKQEAITAQNAQVDIVSGASDSSNAFRQSLASALSQAK